MPRRNSGPRLRFFERRGCYYIFWTEGGRSRERSTGTTDREEAEKALAVFIFTRTRRAGPRGPDETLVTTVLGDYAEVHVDTLGFDRIAYAVRALVPFWHDRTVAEVNESTCRQYAKHRGVSDGTARRELSVLRTAINYAAKSNRLTHAPAVWLPKAPEPLDVWLTRGEVGRLLRAARMLQNARHLPLAILLLVYTGRRKDAVLGLRWAQVDFERGVIDYRRGGVAETLKRRGVVKAHRKLLGHLRRAKVCQGAGEMDFVIQWGGHRVKDIKKAFAAAAGRSGINKRITPHTLKHTAATWLLQDGVSLWDASQYLSTSMETLERVYGHHCPSHQERALKAFR